MMAFYAMATLVAVLAAAFLARPLWWKFLSRREPAAGSTVQALSSQLRQLSELHRAGALTDEQFAQSKGTLESRVIEALSAAGHATGAAASPEKPSIALTAGLVVFLFAVAGGGYAWVGSPLLIDGQGGAPATTTTTATGASPTEADNTAAPHALSDEKVAAMIGQLADRLKSKPDDAEGWMMLARSYVVVGKHADAVAAFKQAARLRPDDANLFADYADALAMMNNRTLEGEPVALIERALKLDANNAKALALAGSAAFDRKNYKAAVGYWERLVVADPAGPYSQQVQGGIKEARELAGMPPAEKAPADDASRSASGRVSGKVVLAPGLSDRVKPDDTVFVFARPVDGPRMPLAILRKRAADLPLAFVLDDSMAMSPDAKLSGTQRVMVSARISRSGNAMPQAGDLQGSAAEVAVGSAGLVLEINQEVTK